MKAYELLFFVSSSLDKDIRESTMKRVENTILDDKGVIDNTSEWGKRKLAFEIDNLSEGDYTLIDFHADPASIVELDRVLRITDAVVRHMIVKRSDRA
jgi:small subunit ribosomal protein S6